MNFRTEAPFVVTTKGGNLRGVHYSSKSAINAAKDANGHRNIYGRHRGEWKLLVSYFKGVKLP